VQAREVSPLQSCEQQFTPFQLVVFPQDRRTWFGAGMGDTLN
jgi:hypothetical protein